MERPVVVIMLVLLIVMFSGCPAKTDRGPEDASIHVSHCLMNYPELYGGWTASLEVLEVKPKGTKIPWSEVTFNLSDPRDPEGTTGGINPFNGTDQVVVQGWYIRAPRWPTLWK